MEQADCAKGISWWHLVGACYRVSVWRLVLGLLGEAGLVQPGLPEQELVDELQELVAEQLELQTGAEPFCLHDW